MISERKYVSSQGSVCPSCGSDHIEASGFVEVEGSIAWQEVHCLECGSLWIERYQLQGYFDLTVGITRTRYFVSNSGEHHRRLFEGSEEGTWS